jgi:hypothetical protein
MAAICCVACAHKIGAGEGVLGQQSDPRVCCWQCGTFYSMPISLPIVLGSLVAFERPESAAIHAFREVIVSCMPPYLQ